MYPAINPQVTRNVSMVRHGWVDPEFELTDGVALYGRLKYWIMRRDAYVETADYKWKFKSPLHLHNGIDIIDATGSIIGSVWRELFSWQINIKLNNGFEAFFHRTAFLSREWVWESPANGTILRMRSYPFSFKDEFEIAPSTVSDETLALLIFLSTHLIILLRRRRAIR